MARSSSCKASIRPLPTEPGNGTAVCSSAASTSAAEPPPAESARPARPATSGAAAEVPQKFETNDAPIAVVNAQPGAASVTHEPRADHGYSAPDWSTAATEITSG